MEPVHNEDIWDFLRKYCPGITVPETSQIAAYCLFLTADFLVKNTILICETVELCLGALKGSVVASCILTIPRVIDLIDGVIECTPSDEDLSSVAKDLPRGESGEGVVHQHPFHEEKGGSDPEQKLLLDFQKIFALRQTMKEFSAKSLGDLKAEPDKVSNVITREVCQMAALAAFGWECWAKVMRTKGCVGDHMERVNAVGRILADSLERISIGDANPSAWFWAISEPVKDQEAERERTDDLVPDFFCCNPQDLETPSASGEQTKSPSNGGNVQSDTKEGASFSQLLNLWIHQLKQQNDKKDFAN